MPSRLLQPTEAIPNTHVWRSFFQSALRRTFSYRSLESNARAMSGSFCT